MKKIQMLGTARLASISTQANAAVTTRRTLAMVSWGAIILDTILTGKQKRYLRAMGSLLEPIVQVGKLGVAESVVTTAREAIGPRELIKVRVLTNCPQEPAEVMEILADRLAAELVQVIGRKGLLYKRNADEPKIELP